jgi:hypothetical protein
MSDFETGESVIKIMDYSFITSYFWWRLIGISLCAFMLPAYQVHFQKIDIKVVKIIFGITVVLVHAFICYKFGFLAFIAGIILWIVIAFLINKLFAAVAKEEED